MFNGNNGGAALCCDVKSSGGRLPLPEDATIVSLGPISSCGAVAAQAKDAQAVGPELSASGRTVLGREFPFPLVDPFGPAVDTGAPITGLTAFPRRRHLGRQYYGLDPISIVEDQKSTIRQEPVVSQEDMDTAFGQLPGSFYDPFSIGSSGGGIDWNQVIANISQAVPQSIAATQSGSRYVYVSPGAQGQTYQQPYYNAQGQPYYPGGSAAGVGAAAGGALGSVGSSLSAFIQQNPLLVLGGTLALVLLFMSPPRRR